MKEINRKGDSLETLKSGVCQDMNTAVILNQSTILRTNEWQGGQHYPIFSPGYHRPVQNLLPIADLKQLSLGKTDNTWANLNAVYSPQLSMVQMFSPAHVTVKVPMSNSVQAQTQRSTQICIGNIPQYNPALTQTNNERTIQSFAPLRPTQFCKTVNPVNPKTTSAHRVLPTTMPDFSQRVTQAITNTTVNYQQSVLQNFGGYMVQKPSNSINVPSSSSATLTELSPYKEKPITKTTQIAKQQELSSQTRKRSSSWPPASGLTKKKAKDNLNKDDQIVEEYENLEMDVARILIRDIPFPVVSVGDKASRVEMSFVGGGGAQGASEEAETTAVVSGEIMSSKKQGSESIPRSGAMHVLNEHAGLWSGEIELDTQSVVDVGNAEPEKQQTLSRSDGRSGDEPGEEPGNEATKSAAGAGEITGSKKQEGQPNAVKQTSLTPLGSARMESENEENKSNTQSGEIVESTKQAKVSSFWSGKERESEKPINSLNTCTGVIQQPTKAATKPLQQDGVGLQSQKDTSNGGTESRASLHFEHEKENYSKNTVSPNKVVFTCEQCMVTFESTEDLISHTASHKSSNFTFKCNVCTQVFRSTNGLQKHIEFHADHRNSFQCSFCFKPFSDRDGLEEHIIESHMSKRPHKCSYCPKAFRDPGSLQKHIRIHTGERPYKCTACEKSFAEYSSLRKHYRVHTGEQPYKCQYCSKAFSISGNLQRHILIHTGERPYKCSECNKTFNNPSHLRRHEKNLHSKLEREK